MSDYKTCNQWRLVNPKEYEYAKKNGMLDTLYELKGWVRVKWTKENVLIEALKYNSQKEWVKGSNGSVQWARKNKIMDICTAHMVSVRNKAGYWQIKENVLNEALKHNNIKKWQTISSASYSSAKKNGWFEEAKAHMVRLSKPSGYWTLERCKKEALAFDMKERWKKGHMSSYAAARVNNWVDDCCEHMIEHRKPNGYWTKERCIEEALKYDKVSFFEKKCPSGYRAARRNGWVSECTAHTEYRKNKK